MSDHLSQTHFRHKNRLALSGEAEGKLEIDPVALPDRSHFHAVRPRIEELHTNDRSIAVGIDMKGWRQLLGAVDRRLRFLDEEHVESIGLRVVCV